MLSLGIKGESTHFLVEIKTVRIARIFAASAIGLALFGCGSHGVVPTTGGGQPALPGSVSLEPAPSSTSTIQFTVPTAHSEPDGDTLGPDGNVWFTEHMGNKVGFITPSGSITEFSIPTASSKPVGIATGPDHNVWFVENTGNNVGMVTPAGAFTEFPLPFPGSEPGDITAGPDGNLWFTEIFHNKVGRITTGGTLTEFKIPTPRSHPDFITPGPDGAMWFTENTGNKIGRITTAGALTEFPVPTAGSIPSGIVSAYNVLWFCESQASKIGILTLTGGIREFPTPTANAGPKDIILGPPDDPVVQMWFTETNVNKIASINPNDGVITEYPMPLRSKKPFFLAVGSDNDLWVTELGANSIGRFLGI
jgi:virginiamycin B lyase